MSGSIEKQFEDELKDVLDKLKHYYDKGEFNNAFDLIDEYKPQFENTSDPTIKFTYLTFQGRLFGQRSRWQEYWNCFDEAYEIVQENLDEDPVWKDRGRETLLGIGKVTFRLGDYETSKDFLERALEGGSDTLIDAEVHIEMGGLYAEMGEMHKSIIHFLKGIELLEGHDEPQISARVMNNLADAYNKIDQHEEAFEYASKGVEISRKNDFKKLTAFNSMNASTAKLRLGDIDGAREYFALVEENFEHEQDPYSLGAMKNLEGMIETQAGNYTKAEEAFLEAMSLLEQADIRYYQARIYHEYGRMLEMTDQPHKAKEMYEKALDLLESDQCRIEADKVCRRLDGLE